MKEEDNEDDMSVDNVDTSPEPPSHILDIYTEATPTIKALQQNPLNIQALQFVRTELNGKIAQVNRANSILEGN